MLLYKEARKVLVEVEKPATTILTDQQDAHDLLGQRDVGCFISSRQRLLRRSSSHSNRTATLFGNSLKDEQRVFDDDFVGPSQAIHAGRSVTNVQIKDWNEGEGEGGARA